MRINPSGLVYRARQWIKRNQCPIPLDLFAEILGAGLDATRIEEYLLNEQGAL